MTAAVRRFFNMVVISLVNTGGIKIIVTDNEVA